MHQICNAEPPPLAELRAGVPRGARRGDRSARCQEARRPPRRLGRVRAGAVRRWWRASEVPRGQLQGVLDSERFNLLRSSTSSPASATSSCGRWCTARSGSASPSAMRCTARAGGAHLPHHRAGRGRGVSRRPAGGAARRRAPRSARWSISRRARTCAAQRRRHRRPSPPPRSRSRRRRWRSSAPAAGICSTRPSSACWCGACTPRTRRWRTRGASCEMRCGAPSAAVALCRCRIATAVLQSAPASCHTEGRRRHEDN